MNGVASAPETEASGQDAKPFRRFWLSPVSWLLIPVLLAILIVAHGCHTGDHDDEPLFVPWSEKQEPPR